MNTQSEVTRTSTNGSEKQASANLGSAAAIRPAVDIFENDDGITLQADMPGVSKERLDVRVEGNNLFVEGTIGIAPQDHMSALYADVRSTVYRRSFVLGQELESGKIEANLRDGVLTVRIPKRAELRPRRIEVSS